MTIPEEVREAVQRVLRKARFLPGEDKQYSWRLASLPAAARLALAAVLAGPEHVVVPKPQRSTTMDFARHIYFGDPLTASQAQEGESPNAVPSSEPFPKP